MRVFTHQTCTNRPGVCIGGTGRSGEHALGGERVGDTYDSDESAPSLPIGLLFVQVALESSRGR
ncbi:hypothetical protein PHMEG_0002421 [Phytophthora megakarya]|uniref:Uncharacterized protein n=1 Tax=Phytophthora megakarya TaxID=4795 RepID=A0A225WZ68_9STRA|nr:hypothetical protein PHMEG_0002421 [Phytophthora megakarya]